MKNNLFKALSTAFQTSAAYLAQLATGDANLGLVPARVLSEKAEAHLRARTPKQPPQGF